MSPCHGEDRGFDSRQIRQRFISIRDGSVAQLVEHQTENLSVAGALPAWATILVNWVHYCVSFLFNKKPLADANGFIFVTGNYSWVSFGSSSSGRSMPILAIKSSTNFLARRYERSLLTLNKHGRSSYFLASAFSTGIVESA